MNKTILITAAIFGILAISLGAFAAHGLKSLITAASISTFETGVKYQMYHALFLLFVVSTNTLSNRTKLIAYYLALFGVIFFSGSIYALATNELTAFDFRQIALLTPLGGLLLIGAWSFILIEFLKMPTAKIIKK